MGSTISRGRPCPVAQLLLADVSGPEGLPDGATDVVDVVAILGHIVGMSEITVCGPQIP